MFLLGCLPCQAVQVSLQAATPLTAQVTIGPQAATNSYPAGLLPSYTGFNASLTGPGPTGSAGVQWDRTASDVAARVTLQHTLHNPTLDPSFVGSLGPHEFVFEFTTAASRSATLTAFRNVQLSAGAPLAGMQIDIGNDGTIDAANVPISSATTFAVTVGPQPLAVRVIVAATLGSAEFASDYTSFTLTPDNDLQITRLVDGCAAPMPPPPPFVQQTFLHDGIALNVPIWPGVAVLGWQPQPVVLPSGFSLPCLLYPNADAVLTPTGPGFGLPIPANVRPITFYAQGVSLTSFGLMTTDAFAVTAQ